MLSSCICVVLASRLIPRWTVRWFPIYNHTRPHREERSGVRSVSAWLFKENHLLCPKPHKTDRVSHRNLFSTFSHAHTQGVSGETWVSRKTSADNKYFQSGILFHPDRGDKRRSRVDSHVIGRTKQTRGPSDARFPHTEGKKSHFNQSNRPGIWL